MSADGNAIRILVLYDHPEDGRIIVKRLLRDGLAADRADNGPEAVRMLAERSYGILLLDYTVTGTTARAVAQAVRADPRHDAVRIVFHLDAPAQVTDADLNRLRVQGAIAKSAPIDRLLQLLRETGSAGPHAGH